MTALHPHPHVEQHQHQQTSSTSSSVGESTESSASYVVPPRRRLRPRSTSNAMPILLPTSSSFLSSSPPSSTDTFTSTSTPASTTTLASSPPSSSSKKFFLSLKIPPSSSSSASSPSVTHFSSQANAINNNQNQQSNVYTNNNNNMNNKNYNKNNAASTLSARATTTRSSTSNNNINNNNDNMRQLRTFSYIYNEVSYRITVPISAAAIAATAAPDVTNSSSHAQSSSTSSSTPTSTTSYASTKATTAKPTTTTTTTSHNNHHDANHDSLVPVPQLEVFNIYSKKWEIATLTTITTSVRKRHKRSASMDDSQQSSSSSTLNNHNSNNNSEATGEEEMSVFKKALLAFQRNGASFTKPSLLQSSSTSSSSLLTSVSQKNNLEQHKNKSPKSGALSHLITTHNESKALSRLRNNDAKMVLNQIQKHDIQLPPKRMQIERDLQLEYDDDRHLSFRNLPEDTIHYILTFMETCFDQYSQFELSDLYGRFNRTCTLRFLHPNIALNSSVRYLYGKKPGFQRGTIRTLMRNVVHLKFYGTRMNRFLLQFFASLKSDGIETPLLQSIKLPMHFTSTSLYTPIIGTLISNGSILPGATTTADGLPNAGVVNAAVTMDELLNLIPIYEFMIESDKKASTASSTTTSDSSQEEEASASDESNQASKTGQGSESSLTPLTYKSLLTNMQLLSSGGSIPGFLNDYYSHFDNITDLRIQLTTGDLLTIQMIQSIMKSGNLRRFRLESSVAIDAPPGFFKYLLTKCHTEQTEFGDDALSEDPDLPDYDMSPVPVRRTSSSLQVLELDNIYLIGSVLAGMDVNTTLQYLSIRYTCNPNHMFLLGRGDAILINRNRSLKYLTGDLSVTPEFLTQFSSRSLQVLQLSPKFVPNTVAGPKVATTNPPAPPPTNIIANGTVSGLINGLLNGKGLLYTAHDQRIALPHLLKCPCLTELYMHCDQIDFGVSDNSINNRLEESVLALKNHPNLKRIVLYTHNEAFIGNVTVHVESGSCNTSAQSTSTSGSNATTSATTLTTNNAGQSPQQQNPLYINTNVQKVQVICALLRTMVPRVEFLLYNPQDNNSLAQMQWW